MKADIHPKYQKAVIACACGNKIKTGSVKENMEVEICSACHPFYTGQEKLIDTAGRIEKFKARITKAASVPKKAVKPRSSKNKKADKEKAA